MINNRTLSSPSSSSPPSSEFLRCLNTGENDSSLGPTSVVKVGGGLEMMSILERQRAVLKWRQEQQHLRLMQFPQHHPQHYSQQGDFFNDFDVFLSSSGSCSMGPRGQGVNLIICSGDSELNEFLARPVKANSGFESGSNWPEVEGFIGERTMSAVTSCDMENSGVDRSSCRVNFAASRTTSCPPAGAAAVAAVGTGHVAVPNSKKRKAGDKFLHPPKPGEAEDGNTAKKTKVCCVEAEETGHQNAEQQHCNNRNVNNTQRNGNSGNRENKNNREVSGCTSKENNSRASRAQKPDYIHVRARRGQATDSHSLAERVRREKISEKMKYLQDLVPGCNKITGKAGMLDEIINYVQSLQRQVEFLSMKLAAVNPRLDFNIDDFFAKEGVTSCSSNYPMMSATSEMANNQGYSMQYNNSTQQMGPLCGFEIGMNEVVDMGLRRTISVPVALPAETYLDSSSCLAQQMQSCLPWDSADLQSIYTMEFQPPRAQSFPAQTFSGAMEAGCLKMEI